MNRFVDEGASRDVLWEPWEKPGLEHLRLSFSAGPVLADGVIVGVANDQPFHAHYQVRCDARWRVREVQVNLLGSDQSVVRLQADGEGRWTDGAGKPIPALAGCIDVDISATPFTNTLPIRRLRLAPGASAELLVAYVDVPDLRVSAERQRYTRLEAGPGGAFYRFEALPGGFTAELPVDPDGLVIDYPLLFRRVWPG